jgi:hypothetical protein
LVVGVVLLVVASTSVMAGKDDRPNSPHQPNPFREILSKLSEIQDKLNDIGGGEQNHTLRWDRVLPAAQRFVVLAEFNNEAVLDKETGLVWEKAPDNSDRQWFPARDYCINKNVGGRKGWRLPSIPELASLIDPSVLNPALPSGHPFNIRFGSGYWSASSDSQNTANTWGVSFDIGSFFAKSKSNDSGSWCVRGPMQESVH